MYYIVLVIPCVLAWQYYCK